MTRPLASATSVSLATPGRRVLAVVLDAAIVAVPTGVASGIGTALALTGNTLGLVIVGAVGVLALGWTVVFLIMQGGSGSVGQRAVGIRLVNESSGQPIGFGCALLRNLIFGLAGAIIVGYFSVLMDTSGRRQGWHDKVAKTLMVDVDAHTANAASTPPARSGPVPPPPPAPIGRPTFPPAPVAVAHTVPSAQPARFSDAVPFGQPVPFTEASVAPLADDGQTVIGQPTAGGAPRGQQHTPTRSADAPVYAPAPRSAATVPPPGIIAHVPGITADPPRRSADAVTPMPVKANTPPPVAPASSQPAHATPPAPSTAPTVELVWDDGTRHVVTGSALFGRDPLREPDIDAVRVADATLSLSKTHFLISAGVHGAVIVDRASTNGVVVARDGVRTTLRSGEQTPLHRGDLIECGDRWARVEVSR